MIALDNKKSLYSLIRYFDTLRSTGHISKASTRRVLVNTFLAEWLNEDMSYYIDSEDYNVIAKAIRKISGDCLIPYEKYCAERTHIGSPLLQGTSILTMFRLTVGIVPTGDKNHDRRYAEASNVRLSENSNLSRR